MPYFSKPKTGPTNIGTVCKMVRFRVLIVDRNQNVYYLKFSIMLEVKSWF